MIEQKVKKSYTAIKSLISISLAVAGLLSLAGCDKNPPTLGSTTVTNTTETSAEASSSAIDDGGEKITEKGVVWSVTKTPTTSSSKLNNGSGVGDIKVTMQGLKASTTYYIRSYAINKEGTGYGAETPFTTPAKKPVLTTSIVSSVGPTSALSGGDISDTGGVTITARGVVWSVNANPTIDLPTKSVDGSGAGVFTSSITGLLPLTKYFVRAYATNSGGTGYGNEISFTTSASVVLTTAEPSNVKAISATSGGNVTEDGGNPITARGIVWSTTPAPTVSLPNKSVNGSGKGVFVSDLTDLSPQTKYYVRAYATNSAGTTYGNEVSFTTTNVPALTTSTVTGITRNSATSGGNISDNGGNAITARGVVWSKSPSPTTALTTKTSDGTGSGSFTSSMTDLSENTLYYVRAYAINESGGTGYGQELSFTTASNLPIIDTKAVTNIGPYAAYSGGDLLGTGGSSITAWGITWSTTSAPTIALSTKTNQIVTADNAFFSSLPDLIPNTKYYVRAYATNSFGTSYGQELSFTTPNASTGNYLMTIIGKAVPEAPIRRVKVTFKVQEKQNGVLVGGVPGLVKQNFSVLENGSPIDLEGKVTIDSTQVPIITKTILLLDVSSSVEQVFPQLKEACLSFIDAKFNDQQIAIYTFDKLPVKKIQDFTANKTLLKEKINALSGTNLENSTNLFGSIISLADDATIDWNEVEKFEEPGEKKIYKINMILFTDGKHNADPSLTLPTVLTKINAKKMNIYVAALQSADLSEQPLKDIATSARYVVATNVTELKAKFKDLQNRIKRDSRSYYYLYYTSPITNPNPYTNNLEIKIKGNLNTAPDGSIKTTFDSKNFGN